MCVLYHTLCACVQFADFDGMRMHTYAGAGASISSTGRAAVFWHWESTWQPGIAQQPRMHFPAFFGVCGMCCLAAAFNHVQIPQAVQSYGAAAITAVGYSVVLARSLFFRQSRHTSST